MDRTCVPSIFFLVFGIWGCDTAPSDPGPLAFQLVEGGYSTDFDPYASSEIRDCFFQSEAGSHRLDAGWLELRPDGDFEFTFVGQLFPYESTSPETLRVAGGYERYGSLLRLSPDGAPIWFATLGPDLARPSTLVLADYSPAGTYPLLGSGRCRQLVFSSANVEPDRRVSGGAEAASFDLVHIYADNASIDVPSPFFGRLGNNRYDSARVDLRRDGSYQFTLWHLAGNHYVEDDTSRVASTAEGRYIKEGSLYAFDTGTARMAVAAARGDSLMLYRNYWNFSLGQQGDLLFHRR